MLSQLANFMQECLGFASMKSLSDRLWDRTGLTLVGWVAAIIAVISFSFALVLAHNKEVQHQREQQQIRDTLREIRDRLP